MKYVEDRIKRITNQFWKDVLQSLININKKTLVRPKKKLLDSQAIFGENR